MTTRRSFLQAAGAAPLALTAAAAEQVTRKGRLKQCATMGCFKGMSIEDAAREGARLGLKGIDLVGPKDWPTLKKHGLIPTMMGSAGHSLTDGINRKEAHAQIEGPFREMLDRVAAWRAPNLIALSGNRRGMSDEEGIENCAAFLNRVKTQAEDKGVTICLELLNSKVDHHDYQGDRTRHQSGTLASTQCLIPTDRARKPLDGWRRQVSVGDGGGDPQRTLLVDPRLVPGL